MPDTHTLKVADGRTVGYVDYGPSNGAAVLWCHGGPGSRMEAAALAPITANAGFRVIGIDRPGYGKSTPQPGRSIADWVPDGLAVADALALDAFTTVGCSTGGAYALALAARAPQRVRAVVACCALTDMRWREGKALMTAPAVTGIWSARDRKAALAVATDIMGADGSKMLDQAGVGAPMPPADLALMQDPTWLAGMTAALTEMFAFSVQGYVDDRLADGVGWGSFDVGAIRCPVVVLHGEADNVVPAAHARHTAAIVPGAALDIVPELGHFSIVSRVLPTLESLARSAAGTRR
jgi:pimeloyl-ACP methyl ester carboxylesterase